MPRHVRLRLLLRGLVKLVAVVAVAGAAGVGLGAGLAALTGDDSPSGLVGTASTSSTARRATTTNQTTVGSAAQRPEGAGARAGAVLVEVVSAVLHRVPTPAAQRRDRARLSVHVRIANQGERTVANAAPVVLAAQQSVPADRSAVDASGSLLRPIAAGSVADGTLRFEISGAVTESVVRARRARLRIAGKTINKSVVIGSPTRSADRSP